MQSKFPWGTVLPTLFNADLPGVAVQSTMPKPQVHRRDYLVSARCSFFFCWKVQGVMSLKRKLLQKWLCLPIQCSSSSRSRLGWEKRSLACSPKPWWVTGPEWFYTFALWNFSFSILPGLYTVLVNSSLFQLHTGEQRGECHLQRIPVCSFSIHNYKCSYSPASSFPLPRAHFPAVYLSAAPAGTEIPSVFHAWLTVLPCAIPRVRLLAGAGHWHGHSLSARAARLHNN